MSGTNNTGALAAEQMKKASRLESVVVARMAGKSYRKIATELGIPASTAHEYATEALNAYRETARERAGQLVELEQQRLDAIQAANWANAMQGSKTAADTVLRVMERRAKLLGLDAPTKIAPTDPSGDNPYLAASDDELRALAAKVAAGAAGDTERTEQP